MIEAQIYYSRYIVEPRVYYKLLVEHIASVTGAIYCPHIILVISTIVWEKFDVKKILSLVRHDEH